MKKIIYCLFGFLVFVVGCSTPQHIRKDDYYRYDWGASGAVTGQTQEAMKYHPIYSEEKSSLEGPATYERNVNYFLFGFLPLKQEVKMSEACGNKPFRQAYVDHNLWQAMVSFFTIGIYTPRTIQIWCGNETASN